MHTDEAALQMELVDHPFFVFRDADSGEFAVIYKRKDGNYGVLEPEA
jgi:putative sigma-54 modulation protein